MRLSLVIPLSLAVVFLIVGIYEMMALGPEQGYWAIMLSVAAFFYFLYRKRQA